MIIIYKLSSNLVILVNKLLMNDDWNKLPAINSCSVNTFKNRLDCYIRYNWGF